MTLRSWIVPVLTALAALLAWSAAAQAPQTPAPYTVVSREGRRPLPARTINGQEMFAVDDLTRLFGVLAREDPITGGLTLSMKGQQIVLSAGQDIVSVGGRLVSLPAPPAREGRAWFVPVDFVQRALAPVAGIRLEVRKPSRLILAGEIRMPRVVAQIDPTNAMARVTVDIAPATAATVTQDGSRVLLRFEADLLDASLPATPVPDLIQSIRPEGTAAIALELGPQFASFRTSEQPGAPGTSRIVVEVLAKTTDAPPVSTPPPAEAPPLLDLVPAGSIRTIVIDAGHGGSEDGARGPNGAVEKQVTLAVARRFKTALENRLGVRVIMTRDGDQLVGLDERAAVANNNKADLFVSLHANASVRAQVTGAEVFYLSLEEYGEEAQRAAFSARESLPVFGGGSRDIEVVPWSLAQAKHIEQSGIFARLLERSLRSRVAMSPRAIQQAPFRVLVGANMPAVLLEMGFMTNAGQEAQLTSDAYQNEIVQALVEAVVQYRDSRAPAPARTGLSSR